jgi:uncharacterized protein YndB with AHSA1/START domain
MARLTVRPVKASVHVKAPPEEVFAYASDTRNDPEWCPNVESVALVQGDGVAVGTKFRFRQHLDRPRGERLQFDVDVEVVELGERSITWQTQDRFQTREIKLTVEEEGTGSRVTQETRATFRRPPGIAARWAYPLLARRTFADQFQRLAAQLDR